MTPLTWPLLVALSLPAPAARELPKADFPLLLSGVLVSAQLADTKSTFDVGNTCARMGIDPNGPQCRERNPLTRWAIEKGPGVTYPLALAADAGVMLLAHKLRKDGKWYWWVAPVALASVHATCAVRNWYRNAGPR
jgi:hypothetical protein